MADKSLGFSIGARDNASGAFVKLSAAVQAAAKSVKDLDKAKASPKLDVDASALQTKLAEAKAKLAQLQAQKADPTIDADIRAAETKIDAIKAKLEQLRTLKSTPKVEADIAKAEADLVRLGQRLQSLNDKRASPKVDANISAAQAKIASLEATLTALGNKRVNISAHVDSAGFEQAASGAAALAVNAARATAAVAALGAAAPAIANLASAFASAAGAAGLIPSLVVAGATAIGSIQIGLGGVSDAYNAVTQAASGGGGAASSSAAQQISAARSIEDAQRAVADAYLQADRQAIQSGQAVADARIALSRAQQQAAWAVADAEARVAQAQAQSAQRIAAAEQSLAMAQRSAKDAQEALTRAREDATRANRDLQLSVAGAALDEESATIALARAKERLASMPAGSTALDMQEADLAVRQAAQSLAETQNRYQDLQTDAAKAAKAGVEGSDQVVAAQRQVQDANQGVSDAEQALATARTEGAAAVADAEKDLARTKITSQQQVADAQTALDRALQQQQWQQADSAKAIADAQRQLARAIADAGQAAGGASGGVNAAAAAMAKLSPAAQDLVRALVALKPRWEAITKDVQQRQLVGVGDEIRKLAQIYLPILHDALGTVADAENKAFKDVSGLLQTQQAVGDVAAGMGNVSKALAIATQAAKPFAQIFLDFFAVGSKELPALAQGFVNAATNAATFIGQARESGRLQEWIHGGVEAIAELGQIFVNVGGIIVTVLGTAATAGADVFGRIAQLTGEVRNFLNSTQGQTGLKTFFSELADTAAALEPGIKAVGTAIWNIIQTIASSNALPTLGKAFSDAAAAAAPWAEVLVNIATTVIPPIVSGIGTLSPILAPLAAAFVAVWAAMKLWGGFTALLAPIQAGLASTAAATSAYAASGAVGAASAGRLSTAFTNLGKALPVVGVALIAVGTAVGEANKFNDQLEQGLAKGGTAAVTAARQNDVYRTALQQQLNPLALLVKSSDDVKKSFDAQTAAMTPLEQAQQRATQSSNDYWMTVQRFGADSPQAVAAQSKLAQATTDVERAQKDAAAATKTHTQAIEEQTQKVQDALGSDLSFQQALQSVKQAQKDATEAAGQYGAKSDEAVSANLRLAQAANDAAQAAGRKAEADAQAAGSTDTAAVKTAAYATELLSQAATLNGPARDSLLKYAQNLDDSTLKAISASAAASGFRTTVLTLPDGRTVTIVADPAQALATLDATVKQMDNAVGHLQLTADPAQAQANLDALKAAINQSVGTVTINGNQVPAADALAAVEAAINAGAATVTINGNQVPADQAKQTVLDAINRGAGTVTINGNKVPAGQALQQFEQQVNSSRPTPVPVNANTGPADGSLRGLWGTWANKVITWIVSVIGGNAAGNLVMPMARGGITAFADGGMNGKHLTPMDGSQARVVQPNTWRVIGDNPKVPELFAPLDGSARSLSLIAQAAALSGMSMVANRPGPAMPVRQPAPQVTVQVGGDNAALATQIRGLRTDLATGNYGPATVAALQALPGALAAALDASTSPTAAAATSRVRAELGAW